jgi:hypothetical protein
MQKLASALLIQQTGVFKLHTNHKETLPPMIDDAAVMVWLFALYDRYDNIKLIS